MSEEKAPGALRAVGSTVMRAWQPRALTPPTIDPKLEELSAVERTAESLKFFVFEFEYWISPGGRLRAWVALNLLLAIAVAVPIGLLFPLVSVALSFLFDWSRIASGIAGNILAVALTLAAASGVAMATHAMVVAYIKRARQKSREDQNRNGRR